MHKLLLSTSVAVIALLAAGAANADDELLDPAEGPQAVGRCRRATTPICAIRG